MTADSPASGLPQEAVVCTCLSPADGGEAPAFDCPLHGDPSYLLAWVKHQADGLAGALAAERAKVAALQQAVDKVRELVESGSVGYPTYQELRAILPTAEPCANGHTEHLFHATLGWSGFRVLDITNDKGEPHTKWESCAALLPAVSEGAPTPAPCPNCNDTGIVEWHADSFGNLDSAPCDCPAAVVQPNVTPATTCAACGTTRTVCDAGLNTYDTRCCEQCGHGEGK